MTLLLHYLLVFVLFLCPHICIMIDDCNNFHAFNVYYMKEELCVLYPGHIYPSIFVALHHKFELCGNIY